MTDPDMNRQEIVALAERVMLAGVTCRPHHSSWNDEVATQANEIEAALATIGVELASTPPRAHEEQREDDDTYEIGKRDGYELAVQDIDLATGGDGEFYGATDGSTVDVPVMKARVIDRINFRATEEIARLNALVTQLQADHAEYLSGKVLMSQEAFDELTKGREGWVLVPRVPTVDMIVAATEEWLCIAAMEDRAETIWEAMLSASPEAGGGG